MSETDTAPFDRVQIMGRLRVVEKGEHTSLERRQAARIAQLEAALEEAERGLAARFQSGVPKENMEFAWPGSSLAASNALKVVRAALSSPETPDE